MPDGGVTLALTSAGVTATATGATAAAAAAAAASTTFAIYSAVAFVLNAAAMSLLSSVAMGALTKKKDTNRSMSPVDRTHTIQGTDNPREYAYGRSRKGGPMLFNYTTTDNQFFYYIICLASHEIQAIETIHIGDEETITLGSEFEVDTDYTSTGITHYKAVWHETFDPPHKYAGTLNLDVPANRYMWIDTYLGGSSIGVNNRFLSEIVADGGDFISTDTFEGQACLFIKIKHGRGLWRGIPKVSATIQGKNNILDTRTSTRGYTTNAALIINDYMRDTVIGPSVLAAEIETAEVDASANVCDQSIALNGGGSESRYTINGVLDSSSRPSDILDNMFSAMAGAYSYTNGLFRLIAGQYQTPTVTLGEDDFIELLTVEKMGIRDKFNAVKGVFVNEDEGWQPTEFPHIINTAYATADGLTIYNDIELPFTISSPTAQRLAKIDNERIRQDLTIQSVLNFRNYDFSAGDTVYVTMASLGFSVKPFDVVERGLIARADKSGNPMLAVSVMLRETSTSVYTWNNDESIIDAAPNTNLPNPFSVTVPTNLVLDSTEAQLIRGASRRVVTRIKATWTPVNNFFVLEGGEYHIQYKKSTDTNYSPSISASGDATSAFIADVDDRVNYDVRVRAVNAWGAASAWLEVTAHTVIGKTTPPDNVTGFTVSEDLGIVKLKWDAVGNIDVDHYEVRYGPTTAQWKDAAPLFETMQGTTESTGLVPPGSWSFMIKAVDQVGNYSNSASVIGPITISNINSVLNNIADGGFPGTLTKFVRHYRGGGTLVPDTVGLASAGGFDTFDWNATTAEDECIYESEVVDLGSDKNVRVWGIVESALLPGITSGVASPKLQIAYRSSTDSAPLGAPVITDLISSSGVFTDCLLHYTGAIVPDSNVLASTNGFDIFDVFNIDAKETCAYESPEIDYGSDQNTTLTLTQDILTGPSETGVPESTTEIDTRSSAGPYDGFSAFNSGAFNLRYAKLKVSWNNVSNVSYINALSLSADTWHDWTGAGNLQGVQYIQARIKELTSVGISKVTDFDWTIDQ